MKLKLAAIGVLSLITLGGCSRTQSLTDIYDLPEGLEDCQVYRVAPMYDKMSRDPITVVRCPKSDTTTIKHSKSHPTATVSSE